MEGLVKLALMVLSEMQAANRIRAGATRTTAAAACFAFAVIAGTAAVGCGVAAVWIYLIPEVGPVTAAFLSGALLLVIALILVAVARNLVTNNAPTRPAPADGTADALLGDIQGLFQRHKAPSLLAALLAGLAAGSSRRR
jgi:hypothetical protein